MAVLPAFFSVVNTTKFSSFAENYRFGFNGMEKDNEVKGIGNSLDFGARIYDSRLGKWLSLDPLQRKFPSVSPYNFVLNSPIIFIDPDGRDVLVAFQGGFQGKGKKMDICKSGTTGKIVDAVRVAALNAGVELDAAVIAPGYTSGSAVSTAFDFVTANYTEGEKVVIYGYSQGGDFAVELAKKLKDKGIAVDLLLTVDAADGPFMGTTVDRDIPDNVKRNLNEYQTTNSIIGSRGDENKAQDPKKTDVINLNLSKSGIKGVNHGTIDEVVQDVNATEIIKTIGAISKKKSFNSGNNSKSSSRSSSESSSDNSSGSSSSSSFDDD